MSLLADEPKVGDDDALYEVIDGQIKEQEPMSAYEGSIASFLNTLLDSFARAHDLGRSVTEILFALSPTLNRRPDVAYVSYGRWPKNRRVPRLNAWEVIPDLAVEVVCTRNTFEEVLGKVSEYFAVGVRRVWVVVPTEERVYVYRSPDEIQVISVPGELRDEELLPGLHISLNDLFDTQAAE